MKAMRQVRGLAAAAWPKPSAPRTRAVRAALAVSAMLALVGCAWAPVATAPESNTRSPELAACADWYTALDAQLDQAGVRDGGASRIAGFAHLRMDRFTASLRDALTVPAGNDAATDHRAALLQLLVELDLQARAHEIANLPGRARALLARTNGAAAQEGLLQHAQQCARLLLAADLTSPARLTSLQERLVVPDDYVTGYRIVGAYGLSRIAFASGIRRFEAQQRAVFASNPAPLAGSTRLRLSVPGRPAAGAVTAQSLAGMLRPAAGDPLRVPAPTPEQLELLFAQFAPDFEVDVVSGDDRPGALVWRAAALPGAAETLAVDTDTPVVYRHTATTRVGAHNLLQLVYTLWFPARTANDGRLDLLAGKLDGLVWRVTLAPDGTPLVYDSIHPCGCYHLFFPTPAAQAKPAPEPDIEWAFSPRTLPSVGLNDRLVLHVAAGTHYLQRVSFNSPGNDQHYTWRDYNGLRSLPVDGQASRSVFGPDGFIAGTDRAEAWLFWPMGIERAGSMRQWGHHATAFVGRRHFDDADLMEKRFAFDPAHFGNPVLPGPAAP